MFNIIVDAAPEKEKERKEEACEDASKKDVQQEVEQIVEEGEPEPTDYDKKRQAKISAKREIKKRFIIGDTYFLKTGKVKREYVCKKYIYSINDVAVNAVIMKQTSGPQSNIYTLNVFDCHRYHIKYEDGLQVMSMAQRWGHKQTSNNKKQ